MISNTIYDHLQDIYNTKVGKLIEPAIILNQSDTVSKVIGKLSKNESYDAFFQEGKSVLTTNVRALLAGKDIADMKIGPFLYSIPHLKSNEKIQRAANIMAHYRIRAVPVLEKGKIIGVVNAKKILKLLASKDNRWIQANLFLTKNPITISANDSLGAARKIMLTKKIDHLPVLKNGAVSQVLTSYHLLHSINPHEGIGRRSIGVKKITSLESKIGNIGSTRIPQCTPNDDLNLILKGMLKTDTTCCLVNLWDNLQGIITIRDILSLLALKIESEIPLFIVGLPEDQSDVDLIVSKFTDTLKRLQKVYTEIQEAKVTIKQQRTGGKKAGKYEVSIRVITPHHSPYIYTEVGFDLSQTLEALSQKLLRNLSKRSKRRNKQSIRKINLPYTSI